MIANKNNSRLLIVFFEGTANTLDPVTTQIGLFATACQAQYAHQSQAKDIPATGSLKMAFDGCGVTHGLAGTLFAAGLDGQCDSVVKVVQQMRKQQQQQQQSASTNNEKQVRVIAVGLSRGAVACQKLALKLSSSEQISISLLLFDPVPGNAVSTGFPYTATKSLNLSNCTNLEQVLALYPYQPLPDVAMHAPCLLQYPPHCRVEEDVSLGCHQGALYMTTPFPKDQYDIASNLSFQRICDWLHQEGVELKFSQDVYQPTVQDCVEWCRRALRVTRKERNHTHTPSSTTRITHDKTGRNRIIIRKYTSENATWLNRHHEQLEAALGNNDDNDNSSFDSPGSASPLTPKYQLDFQDGAFSCTSSWIPIVGCARPELV
jgi:hypothetical protein